MSAYKTATNAEGIIKTRLEKMRADACEVQADGYYCVVTRSEEVVKLPPLSAAMQNVPDAYRLYADTTSIVIQSASPRGILYGWEEWEKQGNINPGYYKENVPSRALRAAHIDIRYGLPNRDRLRSILDTLTELHYNAVILDLEDKLPFTKRPELAGAEHFSPEDLEWLRNYTKEHYLELIPLQQTLGHLEFALRHEQYADLREVRQQPEADLEPLFHHGITSAKHYHDFEEICPCREEGYQLVEDMLEDTLNLFPDSQYIHIGSDEAWNLLYCPDCQAKYGKDGKTKLLLEHIKRIAAKVIEAGRRPIIWDDLLRHMTTEELSQLPSELIVMCWLYYEGDPKADTFIKAYQDAGLEIWGASAAKCSMTAPEYLDLPDYVARNGNTDWWSKACDQYNIPGFAVTVWSNYSGTIAPPHAAFETAWLPLCYAAEKLWDAQTTIEDFLQHFAADFFGVEAPLTGVDRESLLPVAEKAAAEAVRHTHEAKVWYLEILMAFYRVKSAFVVRELYRYNQDITAAEKALIDRRVEEVTRMRNYIKPELEKALRENYSERETQIFIASRFETDEILYNSYKK